MPSLYVQPGFSPNIQTTYGGFGSQNNGSLTRGFMEWDTPLPGYSGLAKVNFQFNPSTLAVAYYNQTATNQAITDYLFSIPQATAAPVVPLQQSLSFALLYDRTYELWGSYGANGWPSNIPFPDMPGAVNNPSAAGVMVDILAMQQLTGMFAVENTGIGNATASPQSNNAPGGAATGEVLKPQNPTLLWPTWVYFGATPAGAYYYGYVTDWQVQITQWTQYMVPMRCVINVDFTLLPTSGAATGARGNGPAGPGLVNWWSANPLGSEPGGTNSPGGSGGPLQPDVTAGGIRG
jgi:hypothetical protein